MKQRQSRNFTGAPVTGVLVTVCLVFLCTGSLVHSVVAGEKEDFLLGQRAYEAGLYRLAQRNMERFLKDYPETKLQGYTNYYLGGSLYQQKKFKEAIKYFQKVISSEPDFPFRQEAFYSLVLSVAEIKDFNLGMNSLQKLREEFPESPYIKKGEEILVSSLLETSENAIKERKYEEAKKYSQIILNNFPSSPLLPFAEYQYGLSLFFLKDYQNSLPYFEKASKSLEKGLRSQSLLKELEVLFNLKLYERAKEIGKQIIRDFPEDKKVVPTAYFYLGLLSKRTKEISSSRKYFRLLFTQFPEDNLSPEAGFELANTYFEEGDFKEARRLYQEVIKKYPEKESARESLLQVGFSFYNEKKSESAISSFQKFISDFASSPLLGKAYYGLGLSLFQKGEEKKGANLWRDYLKMYPEDRFSVNLSAFLGRYYLEKGNLKEAKEVLEKSLKDFPDKENEGILYSLAIIAVQEKEWGKSLFYLDRILTRFPESSLISLTLNQKGEVLFQLKRWEEAASTYKRLAEISEIMRGEALFKAGESLEKKGDFQEAGSLYLKSLTLLKEDSSSYKKALTSLQRLKKEGKIDEEKL